MAMRFQNSGDDRKRKEDRNKPSWREIDAAKDKPSRQRSREDQRREKASSTTAYRHYKSELEALFEKGKVSPTIKSRLGDRAKAVEADSSDTVRRDIIRKVRGASDMQERNRAIDELLKAGYSLPDDMDLLTSLLDYPDEAVVRDALVRIDKLLDRQKLSRKASFVERLKMLVSMSEEEETQQTANRLLDRLR